MKRCDAFTLTELLVLVPIISLVGAVLFASLNSDKQTLQAAQCLSNMRQWGMAFGMYANDYNDYVPYEGSSGDISLSFNLLAWYNILGHYINQPRLVDLYNQNKIPLHGVRSIYVCPSVTPGTQMNGSGTGPSDPWFGYAMNRLLTGKMPSPPGKGLYHRSIAALPAQVILLSESENNNFSFTVGFNLTRFPPRHSGGMNFVFVDGHATWLQLADYSRTASQLSLAINEWIQSHKVYWYPCRTCDKT